MHFLLIGVVIFALYELTAGETSYQDGSVINIERSDIEQLGEQWLQQSGSEADEETLARLVDNQVQEEVMFREAMRLGLDQNDTIIRRRLVQKMDFLSANLSSLDLPGEEMLLEFYEKNSEQYRLQERRSFTHVYFSRDRRGEALLKDAGSLLLQLQKEQPEQRQAEWGDNFILQYDYRGVRQGQLARMFGSVFAEALFALDASGWQGPVMSEYGAHLVLMHEIIASSLPSFSEVREQVRDDYMQEALAKLKKQRYQAMRDRYTINIDSTSN